MFLNIVGNWVKVFKFSRRRNPNDEVLNWLDCDWEKSFPFCTAPPLSPADLNETELEPNKCQQMSTKGNKCPQMVANVNRRSALQVLHNYEAKRKKEQFELQLQWFIFPKPIVTILYWLLETAIIIIKKRLKSWKAQSASPATELIHLSSDQSSSLDRLQ